MTLDPPRQPPSSMPVAAGSPHGQALVAVYDLSVSPLTFDIFPFLIAAEVRRLEAGASSMHFMVVPAEGAARYGDLGQVSDDNLAWRIRQIIVPATSLLASVTAVSVVESRAAAQALLSRLDGPRYPEFYTFERPIAGFSVAEVEASAFASIPIPTLSASAQARAYAGRWLETHAQGRKPISITLREANNATGKNSNLATWAAFIAGVDTLTYFPFVIRDTDRVFEPAPPKLAEVAQFPLAAVNLELRAAIYELSYLNLIGSSGPTMLCMFDSAVRCMIFNLGAPGWSDTTPDAYRKNYGIEPGRQLRHATPFQRLVWGRDDLDTIARHFDVMTRFIEQGEAGLRTDDERAFVLASHETPVAVADRLFTGRQWGPAMTLYRHLVAVEPANAERVFRLGMAETWSGNPRQGIVLLRRAGDLGLASADLYLARCEALMFLGQTDQAIASARYALEIDPQNFDAALRLGLIYEAHGYLDDAERWIEHATTLRADSAEARDYLSAVRSRQRPQAARG